MAPAGTDCCQVMIYRLFECSKQTIMKQNTVIKPGEISNALRRLLLLLAVMLVAVLLAAEIDVIAKGKVSFAYELGNGLVNYSAGFVRRGLFGEILQFMSVLFQPVVSIILLSLLSNLFIFYIILKKMIKLDVGLPYILAIIFSPSLILMHRGEEFIRTDALILSLNFAASCFLLHLISAKNKTSGNLRVARPSFKGMLVVDTVLLSVLTASALIHELSAALLPPVMLLFFVYAKRAHRAMHFVALSVMLFAVYGVMMKSFSFADSDVIAESWAGIYTNTDSFRYSDGLIAVVDKVRAIDCKQRTMSRLADGGWPLFTNMIIAVVLPLIVILLSGIRLFHSSSLRFRIIRCLIVVFSMAPLGLCLVAYDFGRWFSLCALNFTVYCFLIAHHASQVRTPQCPYDPDRKIQSVVIQCGLIAASLVLINLRLNWDGKIYQIAPNPLVYIKHSAENARNVFKDIQPLLARDKVYQPNNLWKFPPWRQNPPRSPGEGQLRGASAPVVVMKHEMSPKR